LKNIAEESAEATPVVLPKSGFEQPAPPSRSADNIAKLETDLATEKEERCEERFIWIAVVFVLVCVPISLVVNFAIFVILFLLGLILLVGIAKRLGVDWAVQGVGWLMHWVSTKANFGGNKDE